MRIPTRHKLNIGAICLNLQRLCIEPLFISQPFHTRFPSTFEPFQSKCETQKPPFFFFFSQSKTFFDQQNKTTSFSYDVNAANRPNQATKRHIQPLRHGLRRQPHAPRAGGAPPLPRHQTHRRRDLRAALQHGRERQRIHRVRRALARDHAGPQPGRPHQPGAAARGLPLLRPRRQRLHHGVGARRLHGQDGPPPHLPRARLHDGRGRQQRRRCHQLQRVRRPHGQIRRRFSRPQCCLKPPSSSSSFSLL